MPVVMQDTVCGDVPGFALLALHSIIRCCATGLLDPDYNHTVGTNTTA